MMKNFSKSLLVVTSLYLPLGFANASNDIIDESTERASQLVVQEEVYSFKSSRILNKKFNENSILLSLPDELIVNIQSVNNDEEFYVFDNDKFLALLSKVCTKLANLTRQQRLEGCKDAYLRLKRGRDINTQNFVDLDLNGFTDNSEEKVIKIQGNLKRITSKLDKMKKNVKEFKKPYNFVADEN